MAKETIDPQAMHAGPFSVPPPERRLYRRSLKALNRARVPYVVSGAYAMYEYTGLWRHTKDLDLFLERRHVPRALEALASAGFDVELTDERWLAKARKGDLFIDLIFAAGNFVAEVDDTWIERAKPARVLGVPTLLASPEDLIRFKAFICERHRFDGADIAHMIQGLRGDLDWRYLVDRMGEHWELLLWHLIFFRYVYPSAANDVPPWVMDELFDRYKKLLADPRKLEKSDAFRGTLVSIFSFQGDVAQGYRDLRTELKNRTPRVAA
jgi:hypothetical protein